MRYLFDIRDSVVEYFSRSYKSLKMDNLNVRQGSLVIITAFGPQFIDNFNGNKTIPDLETKIE